MKPEDWVAQPGVFRVEDASAGRVFAGGGFAMSLSDIWAGEQVIPKQEVRVEARVEARAGCAGHALAVVNAGARINAMSGGGRRAALITGGAGFLGAHLVRELLGKPETGSLFIVARRPEALWRSLEEQFGESAASVARADPRVRLIAADLSNPNCVAEIRREIAVLGGEEKIEVVYHLAAQVHAFAPRGRLAGANEAGAVNAIELARAFAAKLVHASTLSVFVSSSGRGEAVEDWLGDAPSTHVYGGYAQGKAVAESLVAKAMANGLDAKVVRLGLLMPRDGARLAQDHFMRALFRALLDLRALPATAEEALVDFTPVDQAAQALAAIAASPMDGVFHYANPVSGTLTKTVQALVRASEAPEFRVIGDEAWDAAVERLPSLPATLLMAAFRKSQFMRTRARARPLFNADLFQSTDRAYGIERALAAGAPRPDSPEPLLERHIRGLLASV